MKKLLFLLALLFPSPLLAGNIVWSDIVQITNDGTTSWGPISDQFLITDFSVPKDNIIDSYEVIISFNGSVTLDITSARWGFDYSIPYPVPLFVYPYFPTDNPPGIPEEAIAEYFITPGDYSGSPIPLTFTDTTIVLGTQSDTALGSPTISFFVDPPVVPEPSSIIMFINGVAFLVWLYWIIQILSERNRVS